MLLFQHVWFSSNRLQSKCPSLERSAASPLLKIPMTSSASKLRRCQRLAAMEDRSVLVDCISPSASVPFSSSDYCIPCYCLRSLHHEPSPRKTSGSSSRERLSNSTSEIRSTLFSGFLLGNPNFRCHHTEIDSRFHNRSLL